MQNTVKAMSKKCENKHSTAHNHSFYVLKKKVSVEDLAGLVTT